MRSVPRFVRPSSRTMVHSFKRMVASPGTIVGSPAFLPYLNTFSYTLAGITNPSDFSNLYDQYRINYIVAKFWLKIDPSAQTAAGASYPKAYWYRDLDDTSLPTSLNEIRENATAKCVVMNPNRPVTIAFKPNTLNTLYGTALASTYQPVWGVWHDMSQTSTIYYGFKFAIDDLQNTNYQVSTEVTYYLQCRQPR